MNEEPKYAGFWKRFLAYFIDQTLLGIAGFILFLPILFFTGILAFNTEHSDSFRFSAINIPEEFNEVLSEGSIVAIIFAALLLGLLSFLLQWMYYALFESSSKQATPGKMILNLKVTDLSGEKISFGKASGRFFGKIISGLIFNIGYIMAAFTERKQALHDMIAGCLVVEKSYFNLDNISQRDKHEI